MRKGSILLAHPRYFVIELDDSFTIVDNFGKDEDFHISKYNTEGTYIGRSSKNVADDWCYTWNVVELGYCGSCGKKISEVSDGKSYPAVGFHSLDKVVCFYCACSQED